MTTYTHLNVGNSLPGGAYMALDAFTIPVTTGLVGAFYLAMGADAGAINMADGSAALVVGAPTDPGEGLRLGTGVYIDTGLPETAAMTLIFVGKRGGDNTVGVGWMGTYNGATSIGVGLYANANSTGGIGAVVEKTTGQSDVAVGTSTSVWGFYALSIPASGAASLYNLTGGVSQTQSNTSARAVTGDETILIGALPVGDMGFAGPVDMALALVYSGALTKSQIDAIYAWAQPYCAAVGISV